MPIGLLYCSRVIHTPGCTQSARSGTDCERQATKAEARAATELAAVVRDHDTRIAELAGSIGALDAAALRAASLQSSGELLRRYSSEY